MLGALVSLSHSGKCSCLEGAWLCGKQFHHKRSPNSLLGGIGSADGQYSTKKRPFLMREMVSLQTLLRNSLSCGDREPLNRLQSLCSLFCSDEAMRGSSCHDLLPLSFPGFSDFRFPVGRPTAHCSPAVWWPQVFTEAFRHESDS